MFTRSTMPILVALVSLACGASAAAEAFDPLAARRGTVPSRTTSLSSSYALRGVGSDAITISPSSTLRAQLLSAWPEAAPHAGRFNLDRAADDERAGSSASISLGRLNLSEPRGPAFGAASQSDLDRELSQLRDSVNRVRLMPQVSLGMRVKF